MAHGTESRIARPVRNEWDAEKVAGLGAVGRLAYRSNLLGSDRSIANFGGGNTSTKVRERDHVGREIEVLYVKGSGSDLATITEAGFTGFRQDELMTLFARDAMDDAEMVAFLAKCQIDPAMPRGSIETLLHSFIPAPCVDHTHPDAINMICCAVDGDRLARECFGDEALWIPYIRPGFTLAKQVGEAVRANPNAKLVLLAKHGLVTWADDDETVYQRTIDAINRAAEFVNARAPQRATTNALDVAAEVKYDVADLLVKVLPALRGALSRPTVDDNAIHDDGRPVLAHKILTVDVSSDVVEFVSDPETAVLSQIGAACPDHLIHTKVRPLWVPFDPITEGAATLRERLVQGVAEYRAAYAAYHETYNDPDGPEAAPMSDPNPRVILIQGVGMVTAGATRKAADLSRDLYHRSIAVIRGAAALGGFVSLSDEESHAVEYWPLERYKLSLAPPPPELSGRVALVTGGAGGIGRAVGERLHAAGACVVAMDLDGAGADDATLPYGRMGLGVTANVTDEESVARAYAAAVLEFGGVDIIVSNAGLASSAPIEETSVEEWDRNHSVLAKGYFLVSREAFRLLKEQGIGGSIIFVASKNAVYAGKNAAAYSAAKAAELHLARCLAEEGGTAGIRVNTVNPDAVLQGSRIWGSSWRQERAAAYGIKPEELEVYYRNRTTLKVNILPSDIAEAIFFFASDRSSKSTGNMLNVDGGVAAAFPR